jgi:glucosamine--fructose-6-phosphate aminotransferase (isomerizing)
MLTIERDIASQPGVWTVAADLARSHARELPRPGMRLAVIGCGTSYFVAQAIAALREVRGLGESDAFPASEFPADREYDEVIAISRSGTTTEVVRALEAVPPARPSLAISGLTGSPVAQAASKALILDFANEQTVVQTRFATAVLAFARTWLGDDLEPVAAAVRDAADHPLPLDPERFEQFVFLGQGWTYGLASEAALKVRESAGAWAEAYPAMEYRHGPISATTASSLVWALGDVDPGVLEAAANTGATIRADGADPLAELVLAQRMAVALALAKGRDPNAPRHLTRSVVLN